MPEQLLGRIIRFCSNEQDLVLDPFSGSATTVAVARAAGILVAESLTDFEDLITLAVQLGGRPFS